MTKNIIIIGAVGNCIDILDTINRINAACLETDYRCLGFLDDDKKRWGTTVMGLEVLGGISSASKFGDCSFINGIGSSKTFHRKRDIIEKTGVATNRFETIIHPTASISPTARLGKGVVVFQNVTITTNVTIEDHVCILPNSVISHDCTIGNYSCVAGGAIICGNVTIGELCYIGAGSSIREGCSIGNGCLVGMGSVVIDNVKNDLVIAGNPAQRIKRG
jgi:sugar O-acyltransferase (sialic acid O-acetyltransferase NeuD family)